MVPDVVFAAAANVGVEMGSAVTCCGISLYFGLLLAPMTEEDMDGTCEFPLLLLLAVTKPAAKADNVAAVVVVVVAVLW